MEPDYIEWKKEFEKFDINDESVLIGHSAGGGFLVRWLGESNQKIRKLILVAPAIIYDKGFKALDNLLDFKINKNVKILAKEIVIFVSDNEREEIKKSIKIYSKELNIKPKILEGRGHFILKHMGTEEFPELLNEVLSCLNNNI